LGQCVAQQSGGGHLGAAGPGRKLFYSAVLVMAGHIALALLPDLVGVAV
jgi:POT family proton-dependent oligopeptide transporter